MLTRVSMYLWIVPAATPRKTIATTIENGSMGSLPHPAVRYALTGRAAVGYAPPVPLLLGPGAFPLSFPPDDPASCAPASHPPRPTTFCGVPRRKLSMLAAVVSRMRCCASAL